MSTSILALSSSSNGNGNSTAYNGGSDSASNNSLPAGNNREFVEGWTLAQTLGEGAYGE